MSEQAAEGHINHAERAVLGAMLVSGTAAADVIEVVEGRHFLSPRHEMIFNAAAGLVSEGKPHDAVAVGIRLEQLGEIGRCGGNAYLHDLAVDVVVPANAGWFAEQVLEAARKREVRLVGERLRMVSEQDAPAAEVLDAARAAIDAAAGDTRQRGRSRAEVVAGVLASLDEPPGLPTPWQSVSETLGGWRPEVLYVVAARPAKGKSVFGAECALDMARRGKTALFFSLEMSEEELMLRLMSNVGSVDGKRIQNRHLRDTDWSKLRWAGDHLASLPLVIDDRPGLGLAQIKSKIRQVQRRTDVGLVVVDYLQHVKAKPGEKDRRVQVDQIAWGLKEAARELQVPVLALAQLNRGPATRTPDSEGWSNPQVSDLREGGGIEASADVIGLLDRKEGEQGADMRVYWAKNRHGPQAYTDLVFQGHYSRISEPGGWGQ